MNIKAIPIAKIWWIWRKLPNELSPTTTLDDVLGNGNVSGIGMSVGVITATNGYFSGIVTASTINYDNVTDIFSTGIITATAGIQQTGNEGLHVSSGITTVGIFTATKATIGTGVTINNTGINISGIATVGAGL